MFKPTNIKPQPNTDPEKYHLLGSEFKKGDPKFVMSRSQLADFGLCPRKWMRKPLEKPSKAMRWGDIVDCLFLTPDRFDRKFAIAPDTYPCKPTSADPRTSKPWNYQATHCKEWREARDKEGLSVTDREEYTGASAAVKLLMEDEIIVAVRKASDVQVQCLVEWHDEATGLVIPVKVLADLLPKPSSKYGQLIVDFKTTADATPDKWQRHVFDQDYHYQAALYLDAINAATGLEYSKFANIVQESAPPFEVARRVISDEFLSLGRRQYRRDLAFYCQCLKAKQWPGYEEFDVDNDDHPVVDGFRVVEPPIWIQKQILRGQA